MSGSSSSALRMFNSATRASGDWKTGRIFNNMQRVVCSSFKFGGADLSDFPGSTYDSSPAQSTCAAARID